MTNISTLGNDTLEKNEQMSKDVICDLVQAGYKITMVDAPMSRTGDEKIILIRAYQYDPIRSVESIFGEDKNDRVYFYGVWSSGELHSIRYARESEGRR
ncbi:hypothetical protein AU106_gp220 [Sinorhizobium phage phiM9]|uniref:Uncharacterized protein n=1 Tax=Sinorhizobium phage phiM9 TaxID=1636182 RepID=A0A0F6TGV6_9CAUD|nr:hypothetical protein AU106_gp220 [Sinorhizobium phage phiM9]AKE44851.1 hypothetical protein Sm_phiM9_224 [Sinorhizobium phage phiM9]